MLTSNGGEAYGFIRSRADLRMPDLELFFVLAPFFDEGIGDRYEGHAVACGPILLKPHSRGTSPQTNRQAHRRYEKSCAPLIFAPQKPLTTPACCQSQPENSIQLSKI
jgi:hypothetical protein